MDFVGLIKTADGLRMAGLAQTGESVVFTRIAVGDGQLTTGENPQDLTGLVHECMSVPIQSIVPNASGVTLTIVLNNTGLTAGFAVRELGVFATDPSSGLEKLDSYTYAANPDFLPAGGGAVVVEEEIDILIVTANASSMSAQVQSQLYATEEDISNHNESLSAHQDIRSSLSSHIGSVTEHNIPGQISNAIASHRTDVNAHPGYGRYHVHVQPDASSVWSVNHNFNTANIPVVKAYNETTETIDLSGYCGSGLSCGSGSTCGSGDTVTVPVETEIAISNIRLTNQNMLDIRFSEDQSGKAVILI